MMVMVKVTRVVMVVSGRGGDACGMFVRGALGGRVLLACLEGKEIVIQDYDFFTVVDVAWALCSRAA